MAASHATAGKPVPVEYVSETSPVVVLNYDDLSSSELRDWSAPLEAAYGANGLGILVVRGIPDYAERRAALLPLARTFAQLPDAVKAQYEHPISHYQFGWSHGKEQLSQGQPDLAKGSYYANPLHDRPFQAEADMEQKYPSFCAPNIWPTQHPQLVRHVRALARTTYHQNGRYSTSRSELP